MTLSPNMSMPIPVPSTTSGPTYAQNEVTCLDILDSHSHSPGSGVQIGVSGINILGDLPFNSNNLNTVRGLRLVSLSTLPALALDLRMVYSYNGELYYQDASGNNVQLTNAGSVAGATGTITGLSSPASASFSAGRFTFNQNSSKPGRLSISDINLYEYNNAAANAITLKSPVSLASAYSLTMFTALPSQAGLVACDASGNLSVGSPNGTAAAPGYAFASELSTGIYKPGAGTLALSAGGTETLTSTSSAVTVVVPTFNVTPATGSAATTEWTAGAAQILVEASPGNCLIGTTTGDDLQFLQGNSVRGHINNSGGVVWNNGVDSGSSGTFLKWKQFTGTLTASANVQLSISGTVVGATGMTVNHGGSNYFVMATVALSGGTVPQGCGFASVSGSSGINVLNYHGSNSYDYSVIVFYV